MEQLWAFVLAAYMAIGVLFFGLCAFVIDETASDFRAFNIKNKIVCSLFCIGLWFPMIIIWAIHKVFKEKQK